MKAVLYKAKGALALALAMSMFCPQVFAAEAEGREETIDMASEMLDNAFAFLEETFDQSQELVMFVTEITSGHDTSWFVEHFGCDAYFRHNRELLFDETQNRIREQIAAAKNVE